MIYANDTVRKVVKSIREHAKINGVSLLGMTADNFNFYLDDLFADGGEARCVYFVDLVDEYALQFGDFETVEYENAQWRVLDRALAIFEKATKKDEQNKKEALARLLEYEW